MRYFPEWGKKISSADSIAAFFRLTQDRVAYFQYDILIPLELVTGRHPVNSFRAFYKCGTHWGICTFQMAVFQVLLVTGILKTNMMDRSLKTKRPRKQDAHSSVGALKVVECHLDILRKDRDKFKFLLALTSLRANLFC